MRKYNPTWTKRQAALIPVDTFEKIPKRLCPAALHMYTCKASNGRVFDVGYLVSDTKKAYLYIKGDRLARSTAIAMRAEGREV